MLRLCAPHCWYGTMIAATHNGEIAGRGQGFMSVVGSSMLGGSFGDGQGQTIYSQTAKAVSALNGASYRTACRNMAIRGRRGCCRGSGIA